MSCTPGLSQAGSSILAILRGLHFFPDEAKFHRLGVDRHGVGLNRNASNARENLGPGSMRQAGRQATP
jgi:hypothetical protein